MEENAPAMNMLHILCGFIVTHIAIFVENPYVQSSEQRKKQSPCQRKIFINNCRSKRKEKERKEMIEKAEKQMVVERSGGIGATLE